jgi:RHS repeat-associated protein
MNMAGLSHESGVDLPNKFLYNGKELQDDFGLGWYDFHARFYDPAIVRTTTQDPHAEGYYSWSPYHFVANNPISVTDPTGMDWYTSTDGTATKWQEGSDDIDGYTNIGESYTMDLGDGVSITYNQSTAESMTETALTEGDWETQREPVYDDNGNTVGSQNKAGGEGNCFYQAGQMVNNSGATSLGGTTNNINGTDNQINYMNLQVGNGSSIRVHVDYNGDGEGDHWVSISSRTSNLTNNTSTYNFYDPGTLWQDQGTNRNNTFNITNGSITGTTQYSGKAYKIVAVRRNN